MFKPLIKYTLVALIWKKYRHSIMASVVLLAYFWLVGKLHADFIAYSQLQQSHQYLGLSFFIKWAMFALGFATYVYVVFIRSLSTHVVHQEKVSPSTEEDAHSQGSNDKDPFSSLRSKNTLRSKSDLVIDKYPKKKK